DLTEDYSQRARICGLIANIYRDINIIPKAKSIFQEGLKNAENIKDNDEKNWVKTLLYTEYSKALSYEKKYDSADFYNKKSLEVLSKMELDEGVKFQFVVTYLSSGVNFMNAKRWDEAEKEFEKTILSAKGT